MVEVLVKTVFRCATNIAGGDKIIVDEAVCEVYDADFNEAGQFSDVRIELSNGEVLVYGCFEDIEVVTEE